MADIRREKFNKQGQVARDLANLALHEIDDALVEQEALRSRLEYDGFFGDDLDRQLRPITDSDSLAPPIGHYVVPGSVLD